MIKIKEKIAEIRSHLSKEWVGYLMVVPLLIGILVFCYWPPISGLMLAFVEQTSMTAPKFVGFDNFAALFKDQIFLDSIPIMFKILIPRLLISITVPLIIAEIIFNMRKEKAQGVYRILILLPIVAPGIVGLLIWRSIYDPQSGLLIEVVRGLGLAAEGEIIDWLGDPKYIIFSVIFMGFPWIGGTAVLIYMSGLMSISSEMLEASSLDGAGTFRRIISIDFPLLIGQIKYFLVFGLIGGFQDYGIQLVLTEGGPAGATMVPGYYLFQMLDVHDQMGYASAIGVVLFVTIAIFIGISFLIGRKDRNEG